MLPPLNVNDDAKPTIEHMKLQRVIESMAMPIARVFTAGSPSVDLPELAPVVQASTRIRSRQMFVVFLVYPHDANAHLAERCGLSIARTDQLPAICFSYSLDASAPGYGSRKAAWKRAPMRGLGALAAPPPPPTLSHL